MKIRPTQKQLDFMEWEFGLFFHFGIRTFYPGHKDWDGHEAEMTPDGFQPPNLDCRQWIRTAKEAGASYAVMTCKHHDGFANWPSAYTSYNISQTPWKGGKGDVVADYVAACREFGLKVGLYFSPADANIIEKKLTAEEYDQNFIDQISELLSTSSSVSRLTSYTFDNSRTFSIPFPAIPISFRETEDPVCADGKCSLHTEAHSKTAYFCLAALLSA